MDVQYCMPNRKYLETPTVLISTNYPILLDRVSLAFHATRCCTELTFCNRVEHYYVAWAYGVVHKRSAAARRSVPFVSRDLRGYLYDSVRDLREIATVIHRICVHEYCVRSLAFTL